MGGFFGVASKTDCVLDVFYGVDYHSHVGTRRGGMATYGEHGFDRAIHNIENTPFRTKFDKYFAIIIVNYNIAFIIRLWSFSPTGFTTIFPDVCIISFTI